VCDIYKEHEKKRRRILGVVELKVNPQRFIIKLDRTLTSKREREREAFSQVDKR
jgi:hypothetical protein